MKANTLMINMTEFGGLSRMANEWSEGRKGIDSDSDALTLFYFRYQTQAARVITHSARSLNNNKISIMIRPWSRNPFCATGIINWTGCLQCK